MDVALIVFVVPDVVGVDVVVTGIVLGLCVAVLLDLSLLRSHVGYLHTGKASLMYFSPLCSI